MKSCILFLILVLQCNTFYELNIQGMAAVFHLPLVSCGHYSTMVVTCFSGWMNEEVF